jgi:hypothetical protein
VDESETGGEQGECKTSVGWLCRFDKCARPTAGYEDGMISD